MNLTPLSVFFAGTDNTPQLACGIAIAEELQRLLPAGELVFAAPRGERLVRDAGFKLLQRNAPEIGRGTVRSLANRWSDYHWARRKLKAAAPVAVVALGGSSGVGTARAAVRLDIPLVVVEPDAVASSTSRSLARWASAVCLGFEQTRSQFQAACPVSVTGVPIRAIDHRYYWERTGYLGPKQSKRLVVISDAANPLDQQVPMALRRVCKYLSGWKVVHLADQLDATRAAYHKLGLPVIVGPRTTDATSLIASADLVIAPPVSSTLACVTSAGAPTIAVWSSLSNGNADARNVEAYRAFGACMTVGYKSPERLNVILATALERALTHPRLLARLSRTGAAFARPDAAWRIATRIRDLAIPRRARAA